LEGTVFRDFEFRFTPEFGTSTPVIRDAWLNYQYDDAAQLRMGKMKPPGGLERWQAVANVPFIERAMVQICGPAATSGSCFMASCGAVTKQMPGGSTPADCFITHSAPSMEWATAGRRQFRF
jgi:hypothetical protein